MVVLARGPWVPSRQPWVRVLFGALRPRSSRGTSVPSQEGRLGALLAAVVSLALLPATLPSVSQAGAAWSSREAPAGPEAPRRARPRSSAFQGQATSVAGDEGLPTESEVSEHLSASSACATYSEDFDSPPSPAALGPATPSEAALDGTLATSSGCSSSLRTEPPKPPRAGKQRGWGVERRTLKEAAVQTLDPAFTYQWTKGECSGLWGPGWPGQALGV